MSARRLFWLFTFVGLLGFGVATWRGDVPRWIGRWLVIDTADEALLGASDADVALRVVVPFSGDGVETVAAEWLVRGDADRCVVLQGSPNRVVQLGVMPTDADITIEAMVDQGADEEAIEVLRFTGITNVHWDRALAEWLREHEEAELTILCGEFESRKVCRQLRLVIPEQVAERVRYRPLVDRRFDQSNWWRSRLGVRHVIGNYFSLVSRWVFSPPPPMKVRPAIEYEEAVLAEG